MTTANAAEIVREFLNARTTPEPGECVKDTTLYKVYRQWTPGNVTPMGSRDFERAMNELGYRCGWINLSLRRNT